MLPSTSSITWLISVILHVELMQVAEFSAGGMAWAMAALISALYAPHRAYGGPDGLKRLVDACHRTTISEPRESILALLGHVSPTVTQRLGEKRSISTVRSNHIRQFFVTTH
jgi:hypothetical protein